VSPRKPHPDEVRQERRRQILQAAVDLFAANGLSQTGISQVARAAGVSHGTVFLYFDNKDELFRAAVLEPLQEAREYFMNVGSLPGTPWEKIQVMVREQIRSFATQPSYVRLAHYVIGQRERFPELAQACFDFAAEYAAKLAEVIAAGQALGELAPSDPLQTAWAYFFFLNGAALTIIGADPDSYPWQSAAEHALRLFAPLTPPVHPSAKPVPPAPKKEAPPCP
jgi:AcrR family transcriptional regulator